MEARPAFEGRERMNVSREITKRRPGFME
ncbi:hypothetical protein A2U01_0102851, partial [Trifolium medium]|nr:hypothetical protein [Trifolium medium]